MEETKINPTIPKPVEPEPEAHTFVVIMKVGRPIIERDYRTALFGVDVKKPVSREAIERIIVQHIDPITFEVIPVTSNMALHGNNIKRRIVPNGW